VVAILVSRSISKHKLCIAPSNDDFLRGRYLLHFYIVSQSFRRITVEWQIKTDAKWWQKFTWPYQSGELKSEMWFHKVPVNISKRQLAYLSQRIFIGCVVGWIVINNQIIRSYIAIAKKWQHWTHNFLGAFLTGQKKNTDIFYFKCK